MQVPLFIRSVSVLYRNQAALPINFTACALAGILTGDIKT